MKETAVIKSIIFDMGNVLLFFDAKRSAKAFSEATGVAEEKIWQDFFVSDMEKSYTRGEISTAEFFERSNEYLNGKLDFKAFSCFWNEIFTANHEIESLLDRLAKRYPLYVISNTNDLHYEYVRREFEWLLNYFKKCYPSHEVGHRKPDPKIFEYVLNEIGLKPEEAVFIDDMPEFVEGAKQVGMKAVQFKSCKDLEQTLREAGVDF